MSVNNILVVDDHPLFRVGLINVIESEEDLLVVGEAGNMSGAIDCLGKHSVALAIVDLSLNGSNGLELIRHMQCQYPEVLILVISMHDEDLYAERVLHAGAKGFINKQDASANIIHAIRKVLSGKTYVSDKIAESAHQSVKPSFDMKHPGLARLSGREMEVFLLIAQGMNTRDISRQLYRSIKTIETHRDHIRKKLSLESAAELNRYAALYMSDH